MKLLNLGCGSRFVNIADWTNIDTNGDGVTVMKFAFTEQIPFPENSFDLVYHSHMLEHLNQDEANNLIKECLRVLKPGGTLRIAVPDLEKIAINYLKFLNEGIGNPESEEIAANYDWTMLEMYDQTVRTKSGGEMQKFLERDHIINKDFIIERCGKEVERIFSHYKLKNRSTPPPNTSLIRNIIHTLRNPKTLKVKTLQYLMGSDKDLLDEVKFRKTGEIHKWMYDRYSLSRLLKSHGFKNIQVKNALTSNLPGWSAFNLDTEPNGDVYKPDSLYMEAQK